MISKNKIKFIQSLSAKKERENSGLFIAEGEKLVFELLKANYEIHTIISTNENLTLINKTKSEFISVSESEMKKISSLKTPPPILAIVKQPLSLKIPYILPLDLILVLDSIQDPGNLGTIIRLASWFGISTIICSENCVDCFNPKVVQATMGAIAHVKFIYINLTNILQQALSENRTIYGTFLEGENIYTSQLDKNGIVVLGNEGKGISNEVGKLISKKILIPSFSSEGKNIESLNVSVAASIVCSEFRRRIY
jgi:RNA methyltransferase, TrmH family